MISGVQHESVCEGENVESEGHGKIKFASFTIHQVGTNRFFFFYRLQRLLFWSQWHNKS